MPSRICCTVIAGVIFFPALSFHNQEQTGDQRQDLMVMPAATISDFIVTHTNFTLPALNAFFDAMFGLRNAAEF